MKIFLLILLIPILSQAQPPGWEDNDTKTIIMRGDTIYFKNWTRSDSVPFLSMSKVKEIVKDSAKAAITLSNITTALGYAPLNRYAINVQALTSSPTDAQTIYFGSLPKAPVTAAATSKVYIRKGGAIKAAEIYCYSGTAGSNESWTIYIRKNNTTDTQIATLAVSASERVFSNSNLSIPVAAGDYIEIKSINPTWGTNPLTTIFSGYIIIE